MRFIHHTHLFGEVGPKPYVEDNLVCCQRMVESLSSGVFYIYTEWQDYIQ